MGEFLSHETLWQNKLYIETASLVILFLIAVGILVFTMKIRNPKWIGAWASLKSWFVAAPLVFVFAGLPAPWPFVGTIFASIYGAKTFYRMTGMYHRSWFIWASYFFIFFQGYLIYRGYDRFFNIMPMLFFVSLALIPILRNATERMIQYTALSLMSFIFFGWSLMHLGRILMWQQGIFVVIYLFILSEFNETALYMSNKLIGRTKPLSNISSRFTLEGFLVSGILTLLLAWGLRRILPDTRDEFYWAAAGLAIIFLGRLGSLLMSVIRRDLGIKEAGVFIIGRDDILARVDKIMFVAPAVFYAYELYTGRMSI